MHKEISSGYGPAGYEEKLSAINLREEQSSEHSRAGTKSNVQGAKRIQWFRFSGVTTRANASSGVWNTGNSKITMHL
jgi:hypothetical protein